MEQCAGHMAGGSVAGHRTVDLAWIGLGVGDELGDRVGGNRLINLHDERPADEAGDRRDVASESKLSHL